MDHRKTGGRIFKKGFKRIRRTEIEAVQKSDRFVVCQSTIVLLRENRKTPSRHERRSLIHHFKNQVKQLDHS